MDTLHEKVPSINFGTCHKPKLFCSKSWDCWRKECNIKLNIICLHQIHARQWGFSSWWWEIHSWTSWCWVKIIMHFSYQVMIPNCFFLIFFCVDGRSIWRIACGLYSWHFCSIVRIAMVLVSLIVYIGAVAVMFCPPLWCKVH